MHLSRLEFSLQAVRISAQTPLISSLSEKVLRGSLCKLRASVVNVFPGNFTTETQSITEFAQRNSFFRQIPKAGTKSQTRTITPSLTAPPSCSVGDPSDQATASFALRAQCGRGRPRSNQL